MNAPIFEYDDRYFLDCKHTREELYKLQEIVLQTMKDYPDSYTSQLKQYDQHEVEFMIVRIKHQNYEATKS